jgi:RNA polymerase sigma-70 factor, ECF subfamily
MSEKPPAAVIAGTVHELEGAATGGVAGFEDLVREHQSMVFSIAYHFLQDPGAAEEVAQDVFLQLYRKLPDLESAAHVVFWLRKTACHRSIDRTRRRLRRRQVSLETVGELPSAARWGDPWMSRRLREMVGALPERMRMVLILRFQEELELNEIASVLGIPEGTVKSRLQRAVAKLREKAGRWLGEASV